MKFMFRPALLGKTICIILNFMLVKPEVTVSQDNIMGRREHGGGLLRDCESDILLYLAPGGVDISKSIDIYKTDSFDLSERFLPADWNSFTQGRQFSCTAFAVAFTVTIQRNIDNYLYKITNKLVQYNPAFIFAVAKSKYAEPYKSNCREGISFIDAFLVVRDRGVPFYKPNGYKPDADGCNGLVFDQAVYKEAAGTKIQIFQRPFPKVDNFKRILLDTPFHPICIGAFVNTEYDNALDYNKGKWIKPGIPSERRMHAMLVVGFNNKRHAFKVMDWQGRNKGDNGFLWIDYDLIANKNVVFDAFICSHQSEYIDPRIGARAGSGAVMNESEGKPASIKDVPVNSEFKNDKIDFWIKSGYLTRKNIFQIDCNYVSDDQNRATFRISNKETGEIIIDDLVLTEGTGKCFTYNKITYKLTLVEIAFRGKNIFKKAAVLKFVRNAEC